MHDCTSCQYCEGLSIDPSDQVGFLTCRIKDAVGTSRPPESRLKNGGVGRSALTAIADIMTRSVVCVDPDMTLPSLMTLLLSRNISGVPVVDASGHPVGVVGKTDLVREFSETSGADLSESARFIVHGYEVDLGPGYHLEAVRERTVGDIMMPLSFTLPESAPVARAAALMAYEGVHRVVVVSPVGNVVGILSSLDVLGWIARESGYLMSRDA